MAIKVTVQLTIPMEPDDVKQARSFRFRRWAPLGIEHGLEYRKGEVTCRYWVDEKCVSATRPFDAAELAQFSTVFTWQFHATVATVVDDELGGLITRLTQEKQFTHKHLDATYGKELIDRHDQFATDIYTMALGGFNRLLAHVRAEKGQYWLSEKELDPGNISSHLHHLKAKVQVEGGDWKTFQVAKPGLTVYGGEIPPEQCGVSETEWKKYEGFISSGRRPELVGTLLSLALELRASGRSRAALIEAVAALETAVSKFVTKAKPGSIYLSSDRYGVANLKAHREHLGFTGTVSYLFPLLFTEEQVSTVTLKGCRGAIEERNNVVHNGQREVREEKLAGYLRAVRSLCEFLLSQCAEDEE